MDVDFKEEELGHGISCCFEVVNVVVMSIVGVVEYRISYQVGRFVIVIVV